MRVLIDQAEAGLQRIEQAALDRPRGRLVVAAIVDEPRLSGVSRILKGPNRVTLLKYVDIARMKLDDIDMICTQSFQAAVDAVDHRQVGPRLAVVAVYSVACFRGEEELLPSA